MAGVSGNREDAIDIVSWLLVLPLGLWLTMVAATLAGLVVLAVERGEPVRFQLPLVSLVAREASARAVFWMARPLGWTASSPVQVPVPADSPTTRPVLLVPGLSQNRAAMSFLRTFLNARGYDWVWAVNPPHHDGLAAGAEALSRQVDELKRRSGAKQIDLVGHGSGGLVAAWYVRHLDEQGTVRRLVTLGTPWRGTRMSVFRKGVLQEETRFGSATLDDLVPGVPTWSIWSADDPTVVPSSSALPDGVESVEILTSGHTEMLMSARAFRAVQAALS